MLKLSASHHRVIELLLLGVIASLVASQIITGNDLAATRKALKAARAEGNKLADENQACEVKATKLRFAAVESLTALYRAEPILEECGRRYFKSRGIPVPAGKIDTR
jgi:hypothetical protein